MTRRSYNSGYEDLEELRVRFEDGSSISIRFRGNLSVEPLK